MKKILPLFVIALLLFPTIIALNLKVEKLSSDEIMVAEIDKPATFLFNITNLGAKENIEFYNLLGFRMFPLGKVPIEPSETKQIEMQLFPIGEFTHLGEYSFNYFIMGFNQSEIEQTLTFTRIELKDAFEIGAGSFDSESSSIELFISNKENFDFGEAKARFYSNFFDEEETFTIGPKERKNVLINIDKEDFKELMAGFYTLYVEIQIDEAYAELQTPLQFLEKQLVKTSEEKYGVLIATKIIKKTNEGNTLANVEIISKKNIISRLFSSFNPEPDFASRKGLVVNYTWTKQIKPGESFEVSVKTNHLFPLIIIILIVVIVAIAKHYSSSNLVLKKKVSFVKAKGGAFALKVTIFAHARKYMENIAITDRFPPLVKIYEKFGQEKPSKIDSKKLEWNYPKLEPGEIRMMTYIIYSKVGVLGKFALPETRGVYEREGKLHETESNKTFFIAEPRPSEEG
jgi:hypothetical protein